MEAATLPKKKVISKGKVKKTIKNVLCRPDPLFWPDLTPEDGKTLEVILSKHRVDIPEFKKPHWKEIKSLPKEQRPRPPKITRVDGLIFGITECRIAVENKDIYAIILEASLNPRAIAQPLIEACIDNSITILCLDGLRKLTQTNFGIPTSCLGIKESLENVKDTINNIAKSYTPPERFQSMNENINEEMDINNTVTSEDKPETITPCPYLYRSNIRTRVFNPSLEKVKSKEEFIGQDFIELSAQNTIENNRSAYMSMIVKRITNNPNRIKRKLTDCN